MARMAELAAQLPHGPLHDAVRRIGDTADGILRVRQAEEDNRGYPKGPDLFHLLDETVHGKLELSRKGGDRVLQIPPVFHEQRGDKIFDGTYLFC